MAKETIVDGQALSSGFMAGVMPYVLDDDEPLAGFNNAVQNGQTRLALEYARVLFEQILFPTDTDVTSEHMTAASTGHIGEHEALREEVKALREEIETLKASKAPSRKVGGKKPVEAPAPPAEIPAPE
jgi:hypothetical protein